MRESGNRESVSDRGRVTVGGKEGTYLAAVEGVQMCQGGGAVTISWNRSSVDMVN